MKYNDPNIAGASNGKVAVAAVRLGNAVYLWHYVPKSADLKTIKSLFKKAKEKLK